MLQYDIEVKKFGELCSRVEIPKFQRGLVWNREKKQGFIKSLKSGLPIGVLLMSKREDRYLVIDGLQRFTTMKDYARDFFSYIEREEITDSDLMAVILASETGRAIFDGFTPDAQQKIRDTMRNVIAENISGRQNRNFLEISLDTASELCGKIPAFPEKDMLSLSKQIYVVIERISKQAQIDDITIPLIIFKGREEELADIFQKLNQEGVRLSKYDVFAATWIDHFVTVRDDPKFIDYIINKYEAAQRDSDLDIADYDPDEMKQSGRLTVFEYAFAVGKALMDKCKMLFPRMDDAKIDSIGFLLLAELMGLTYQKMGQLADVIETYENLDYKKLKDAILDAGSIVESALTPYIDSPANKKKSLVCHSELQLASYIIVVFKLKYSLTPQEGLVPRQRSRDVARVKEYLHKHYLFDILRGFWSGSGDSKLEEIIAEPSACRYTRDVAREEFEVAVSSWLEASNSKAPLTNVSAETKLFLNYLLRGRVHDVGRGSYDIEHCVPKEVIKRYYRKKNIVVPMSSVCNLVYIPEKDNRSKGELTYYQRQDSDPGAFSLNQEQLDTLVYPRREELRFVESISTLTEENYFAFLRKRKQSLQKIMMDILYSG